MLLWYEPGVFKTGEELLGEVGLEALWKLLHDLLIVLPLQLLPE
jgi:hypothetical protein